MLLVRVGNQLCSMYKDMLLVRVGNQLCLMYKDMLLVRVGNQLCFCYSMAGRQWKRVALIHVNQSELSITHGRDLHN